MTKIAAIADQHGVLPAIPECDILVVAGDICPVDAPHDPATQAHWLDTEFRQWLDRVPATHVVGIAGNHDFVFEAKAHPRDLRWTYLQDSGCEIEGIAFWGYPWTPNLPRWAFSTETSSWGAQAHEQIPSGLDILITHGPPLNYLDGVPMDSYSGRKRGQTEDLHVGSEALLGAILDKRPKLSLMGHIHEENGQRAYIEKCELVNVSILDGAYQRVQPATEIEWVAR